MRDVTKAFDKVWRTGLKHKIHQLGIHTCFTRTLVNYITNRTESVQIDSYTGLHFSLGSGLQLIHARPSLTTLNNRIHSICDDITQITAGPYNHRYAAHNTKHVI